MRVIRKAVTAAHLAGYFVTVEARLAVNNVCARKASGDKNGYLQTYVMCRLLAVYVLEELMRPQLLMKPLLYRSRKFSTVFT